jgi:hypothetical protein
MPKGDKPVKTRPSRTKNDPVETELDYDDVPQHLPSDIPASTDPGKVFAGLIAARLVTFAAESLLKQWISSHTPVQQIREMETLAEMVIGDKQEAVKWLSEPNPATDDKAPIDLLGDQAGYERVKNLLLRIEYGVLA